MKQKILVENKLSLIIKRDLPHLISVQGITAFSPSISRVSILVQGLISITVSKVLEVKAEVTQQDTLLQVLSR